jgi:dihydrofolate reductase
MGQIHLHMSMSLDGYIAGPDVSVEQPMGVGGERLHQWLFAAPPDAEDAEVAGEMYSPAVVGAVLMGRRHFTVGIGQWGDDGAFGMPCFVVTNRPATPVVKGPTTFTFVTEGLDRALEQAQAAAGDKHVNVMGADVAQQLLRTGRIDTIQLNVVPVLLGGGTRLFDRLGPTELEQVAVVPTSTVTHIRYHVVSPPG